MVYKNNPFFALCPKMEDFGGRNMPVVTVWGTPQGRSATFTSAQTRGLATSSKISDFLLTRVKDYSIAYIDNETLESSKGNVDAFMEAATTEINGAIRALTRSLAIGMYKTGFGEIGQIGSSVSGATTITLKSITDVTNFEVGMELDVSDTVGASVLRTRGSSTNGLIVTAVNRTTGVLTFGYAIDNSTNGIPAIAQNDYLFPSGDRQSASSPARLKLSGFGAWVPSSAPSGSDSFFNINRSVDTRLGGLRLDVSTLPIEEAVIEASSLAAREGATPDYLFLNYSKWNDLQKALGTKVQYVDVAVPNIEWSFRGIIVNGPTGPIKVIPDQNCPAGTGSMIQLDTWKLNSLGKAVRVIDTDGLQMLRVSNADSVEVRYGFYGNMSCNAPGWNLNMAF